MVEKDWNHPSVIMYSTGNEIPEAGTPRGAEWNRKLNAEIKRLDSTRYTTSGINGLMAASDRMGEILCQASGMSPEELEAMMAQESSGEAGENDPGQTGDQGGRCGQRDGVGHGRCACRCDRRKSDSGRVDR